MSLSFSFSRLSQLDLVVKRERLTLNLKGGNRLLTPFWFLRTAVDRADAGDEGGQVGERHEATVRILDERIQRLTAIRALVK